MSPTLVIANKNYSSWSLRPWLAMRQAGIPFEEIVVPLDRDDTAARLAEHSPAGKAPVLKDGDVVVWDSLAILEHLAERHPEARLWPAEPRARALARSIAAEMHSGFSPLRKHYPMNLRKVIEGRAAPAEVRRNIDRIVAIWTDARARFGRDGALLFGAFTAADAMYAPVVTRFETYRIPVPPAARAYMDAVLGLPALQEWYAAARDEPWTIAADEVERGIPIGA